MERVEPQLIKNEIGNLQPNRTQRQDIHESSEPNTTPDRTTRMDEACADTHASGSNAYLETLRARLCATRELHPSTSKHGQDSTSQVSATETVSSTTCEAEDDSHLKKTTSVPRTLASTIAEPGRTQSSVIPQLNLVEWKDFKNVLVTSRRMI